MRRLATFQKKKKKKKILRSFDLLYPVGVKHTTDTAGRVAICMPHINLILLCTIDTRFTFSQGLFEGGFTLGYAK